MSKKTAFIGLGVMGFPMAGHLIKAGNSVTVYNRTHAVAERWAKNYREAATDQKRANIAMTPAEAAVAADYVMVCVGNDDDVRQVVLAESGALSSMKHGSVLIDHTTGSADLAEELAAACAERGVRFLDAPVSGGELGAKTGALTIMLGGNQDDFAEIKPVIDAYAKAAKLIGAHGHGQKAKMVNQICIAGLLQGLSEALHFAEQSGINVENVVAAISQGAAQSWQMENRANTMLAREFDFGFAVDWMRKDLGIALAAANKLKLELPVTELVDRYYQEVQDSDGGRWDTSSLISRYARPK